MFTYLRPIQTSRLLFHSRVCKSVHLGHSRMQSRQVALNDKMGGVFLGVTECTYDAIRKPFVDCPPPLVDNSQPRRALKRNLREDLVEEFRNKRQRLHQFLDSLPEPLTRSRSDSYLPSSLSTRPDRRWIKIIHYQDQSVSTISGARSVYAHASFKFPASGFADQIRSDSMASYLRLSSGTRESSNQRAAQSTYRDVLNGNRIFLIGPRQAAPEILHHARGIINRSRDSPGLSEEQADEAAVELEKLQRNGGEGAVISTLTVYQVLPHRINSKVEREYNRPFDSRAVPHIQGLPPPAAPRPDQYFAHHYDCFDDRQRIAMQHPSLSMFSQPAVSGYFPFLTIEFKATATKGSIWVAENQAAASGALCVNSIEHLFELVGEVPDQRETIAFSCLMDERSAALRVTYYDRITGRMINVQVAQYSMSEPHDIIGVHNAIKNICDWSLTDRLPPLISALDRFSTTYQDKDVRNPPNNEAWTCL